MGVSSSCRSDLSATSLSAWLRHDTTYATSSSLVRYQYLGFLDFVVAIVTARLFAGAFVSLTPNGVTSITD